MGALGCSGRSLLISPSLPTPVSPKPPRSSQRKASTSLPRTRASRGACTMLWLGVSYSRKRRSLEPLRRSCTPGREHSSP